jgi:hypothetical protein
MVLVGVVGTFAIASRFGALLMGGLMNCFDYFAEFWLWILKKI